ncbi:uncharacterized protein (DUF169 family) [Pseudonocardia sediminis]|uniref:Uncharacterized protein (DUF169 family) n=1 Tax=Pseudonocardia sediminis TaxID=1397368 RepID=A0A4Q7UZY9_PSEST|nr:DUF169 domain-containing protein [Pseudonocardia sediminis]RZT85779.1 uncharacterized protein (DUF169 family) [Pseudonocardia sediminis]
MTSSDLTGALVDLLGLEHPPVAVTIADDAPSAPRAPVVDQPAGCCFWAPAQDAVLDTRAADHAHCSVGSYTHGFLDLEDAAAGADTAALLASGWVTGDDLAAAPRLATRPTAIRYEPFDGAAAPDVVLIRLSPAALTTLQSAVPGLRLTAKPQCQIVPLAAAGTSAVSPGCAVSRVRTGLPAGELTAALPAADVPALVERLRHTRAADDAVAAFARDDLAAFTTA